MISILHIFIPLRYKYQLDMAHIENKDLRITIFEGLGTMIFAYGVGCASLGIKDISSPPDAVLVSCSLLAGLALCAQITDGHLNPLLSIAAHIYKGSRYVYVNMLGQFVGAFLGAILFWLVTGKTAIPVPNTPDGVSDSFEIVKFCINEIVGSFLFGICVLVVTNPRTTYANKSWQMYLAVVVSLFLARKMTGETCVNPALGVAHQLFSAIINSDEARPEMILILLFPSLIGGAIAGYVMRQFYEPMLLYTRFKSELENEDNKNQDQVDADQEVEGHGQGHPQNNPANHD